MDTIMEFLKKPVISLDGFKITVAVIVIAAVLYMVWRSKGR